MGGVWDGEGFEKKGEAGVVFRWVDAGAALTAVRGRLLGTTAVLESAESGVGEYVGMGRLVRRAKRTVPGQYFGVMAQ